MATAVSALVKYVLETAWCYFGLRIFRSPDPQPVFTAGRYGLVRLLAGRVVTLFLSEWLTGISELVLYLLIVLFRWILWYGVARLIARAPGGGLDHPVRGRRSILWRSGGVALSCLADIPQFLFGFWTGHLWV